MNRVIDASSASVGITELNVLRQLGQVMRVGHSNVDDRPRTSGLGTRPWTPCSTPVRRAASSYADSRRSAAVMILEREAELAKLSGLVEESASSGGRVILVRGEAGIGKSTLINWFLTEPANRAHVLMGTCDDLITPQPLGPIWDIARTDPSLLQPLSDGDRRGVMESLLDLLSRPLQPAVVVLEDTQWADEATLDVIKFLGRRIAQVNGLLILTYRDAEVDAEHPLRQVIGDLPAQNIVRMPLSRLSVGAVTSMIESEPFDIEAVLALTNGNPLFVTEVLATGTNAVPLSVRDAVLARVSKVSPAAQRVLELVSVVPGKVEASIVEEIVQPTEEQLAESVRQGLLRVDDTVLSFPHDLQRSAVEGSLTPSARRSLNQQILDALTDSAEPARLVHHATEANDVDAIIRFAPERRERQWRSKAPPKLSPISERSRPTSTDSSQRSRPPSWLTGPKRRLSSTTPNQSGCSTGRSTSAEQQPTHTTLLEP